MPDRDVIDLRSDTVTLPTAGMRAAMAEAEVGDDFYREDPEVRALESEVAGLFGHEAALFTPSGSMANQLALQVLVPPGGELLCDPDAYVVTYQCGSSAALGGISSRTWPSRGGRLDVDAVAGLVRPDGYFAVPTSAVAVENTHNRGGGTVIPLAVLRRLRELADTAGLGLHCDGARIWHAHIAEQTPLHEYGELFDTMAVCLSKGLGAPVGSLLISNTRRIEEARVMRRRLGGGMRQAGILAAAGRYAITHHLARLADDHLNARRLALALAELGIASPTQAQTNIVLIELGATAVTAAGFASAAAEHGLLVVPVGPTTVRAVTHSGVDEAAIERAVQVVTKII